MITIVCTTNRPESMTLNMCQVYHDLIEKRGEEAVVFSMESLPHDILLDLYNKNLAAIKEIAEKYIQPADKLIFISPEYNGSFPGIFKVFIDAGDLYKYFSGKKAALVGISSGRTGNIRGMDHLTDIFHHMRMEVMSYKVSVSRVHEEIGKEGLIVQPDTLKAIEKQIEMFLKF